MKQLVGQGRPWPPFSFGDPLAGDALWEDAGWPSIPRRAKISSGSSTDIKVVRKFRCSGELM